MLWTNKEIVTHLQLFPGDIHIESFPLPAGNRFRVEHKYKLNAGGSVVVVEKDKNYPPPPYNLTLYKGKRLSDDDINT